MTGFPEGYVYENVEEKQIANGDYVLSVVAGEDSGWFYYNEEVAEGKLVLDLEEMTSEGKVLEIYIYYVDGGDMVRVQYYSSNGITPIQYYLYISEYKNGSWSSVKTISLGENQISEITVEWWVENGVRYYKVEYDGETAVNKQYSGDTESDYIWKVVMDYPFQIDKLILYRRWA